MCVCVCVCDAVHPSSPSVGLSVVHGLIASVEEMPQGRASDMGSPPCCLKYATKQKHIHIITLHLTLDIIIHVPHNISQYTSLLFTKFAKPGSV